MKKALLIAVVLIVAVVGAALYFVFTNLDAIVKTVIEQVGSQTTQTTVRVDKVKINLTDGAATINGLSIANPKGFESRHAFLLGAIETRIDLNSLRQGPLTIDQVIVRKPQVFYEMNKRRESNLNELYKNIAASTGGSGGSKKPATKRNEPKLIIRRFLLSDATLEATIAPLNNKKYTLKLPPIELKNLGGRNGATAPEIAHEVLNTITQRALAAVKRAGIGAEEQALKAKAQKKLDTKRSEIEDRTKEKLKSLLGK